MDGENDRELEPELELKEELEEVDARLVCL